MKPVESATEANESVMPHIDASEVEALVTKGGHHFERSLAGDAVTKVRTSETSWCNVPYCEGDATVQRIKQRVSNVTGVPIANSEHIQVLRYEAGQFYKAHHDQNAHPRSPWGPRVFTFFMYLSDVDEGGETTFVRLPNMSVAPKKGRAILWPSVLSTDPFETDERTYHEAMPVVRGLKFAANFWVHMWDFQTYHSVGCANENYVQDGTLERSRPARAKR